MPIDVKTAVGLAKVHIRDLFEDEAIANLGLEEVSHGNGEWFVTIGFSRPWDEARSGLAALASNRSYVNRAYKVVTIDDDTREVVSVKSREPIA